MSVWTRIAIGLDFMTHSEEVDALRAFLKEKDVANVIYILPQMEMQNCDILLAGEIDTGAGFLDSIKTAEKAAEVLESIGYNVTIAKRRDFKAISKDYNWY